VGYKSSVMLTTIASALGGWLPDTTDLTAGGVKPFYLVARPGFWGGFGSVLDIFSPQGWNYVSGFRSLEEIYAVSTYVDWCMVGHDLRQAIAVETPRLAA
jgi:hypothetical protein